MGRHDQLFKDLLRAFFGDFLRLTVPEAVERLDLAHARFLDKETFTDLPGGKRHEADLLFEAPLASKPDESGRIHVEIEARASSRIGLRLRRYALQIRLRHPGPLLSVLVNLRGGPPGPRWEILLEDELGPETDRFRYLVLGLGKNRAEEYLARPEPLAWALAALMHPGSRSPAQHKLACLRPIAAARKLSGARRFLLVNCVETYVQLNPEDAAEYEALRARRENRKVRIMATTWADKMRAEGKKQGLEQGLAKGREKLREVLLRLLEKRFGPLPENVRRRIEAIPSLDDLAQLADQGLVASSLDEIGLA